jgi:hypothetical protein
LSQVKDVHGMLAGVIRQAEISIWECGFAGSKGPHSVPGGIPGVKSYSEPDAPARELEQNLSDTGGNVR